ncbi:MAG TPA: IscS subfamily cysteine desulfurase [Candidatus Latescibacteria bacterium]|jgi:cysteine desulfurase|nr:IscS subfamily cysteine desulfurase [Candidatus Latescibacterota bacterium]
MPVDLPIYMDNHATTRVDPRVLDEMLPFFSDRFGNAASRTHEFGWSAESAIEDAREETANILGAKPKEIIFTSGATESSNLAIKGVAQANVSEGKHVITQVTEHHATLDSCAALERQGFDVTILSVDKTGRIDVDDLRDAIRTDTILVTMMIANNEVGTIQPVTDIGSICREHDILFHTDAAQAIGKIPIDVEEMGIDLLSLSAHKFYGPKGVGALYVRNRPRPRVIAQMDGGGHERGLRSGTINVPGIVGLGTACQVAQQELENEANRVHNLRDNLAGQLTAQLDGLHLNGHPEHRLDGNLNMSFEAIDGESLLMSLKDIALSSGSACTSASLEPSYVLRAMGSTKDLAQSSTRFGLGRFNTQEEVDYVAERVVTEVNRLREISPRCRPANT